MTAILLAVFWFGHEPALVWGLRQGVDRLGAALGVKLDFESVRLHLFVPLEFRNVRFTVTNPPVSRTDVTAASIRVDSTSLWRMLFGDGRFVQSLVVDRLNGIFDFRPEAIIPQPLPEFSPEHDRQIATTILRFLPLDIAVKSSNAIFLAENQSYTVRGVDGTFDELTTGRFDVAEALIEVGSIRQEIHNGTAATAWKNGVMYLSGLRLRDDVVIQDFVANFVNPGGITLDGDFSVFDGSLRLTVEFGTENALPHLDMAIAITNLPLAPIPEVAALDATASGVIRDGRITFRGNPDRIADIELSVRIAADDVRWNDRGWESLVVGANYIGRRLYLPSFELTQAENRISASGEVTIPENLETLPNSRFLVNLSADVRDLSALAALAGSPFEQMAGRLSLHGSLSGENGEIEGYLNGEASGVEYMGLTPASSRVSLVVAGNSLEVRSAELWSGDDRVTARGTIDLRPPHRYSGEITGAVADIGLYAPYAGEAAAGTVFTGAANWQWQGDGAGSSHSGAFRLKLENVMTSLTPTGLTGEFAGTYSPENIYFDTVRLTHGMLELGTRVTIASSGVKISDLALTRRELEILSGEAFVPLNVFALAAGGTLASALDSAKPVYAAFQSGDLSVADLSLMAGQETPVTGRLRVALSASGPLPSLRLSGGITGRDIALAVEDFSVPPTTVDIALDSADGRLVMNGSVAMRGFQPLTLTAGMPFAFEEMEDGGVRLFRTDAPIEARLSFPGASLEMLRPWLPTARHISGTIAGGLNVAGTLAAPKIDGEVNLRGGDIEITTETPRVSAVNGRVVFADSKLTCEFLRGTVGAGPFEITGWADVSNPTEPAIQLSLKGTKVLLARDAGQRLRADLDLSVRGQGSVGEVSGSVRLVDGRVFRRLEVTPLLVPSPEQQAGFEVPTFSGLVPEPYSAWKLNVAVQNGTPFLLMGNLATGEISPELTIGGTLGHPFATGTVFLRNLQAYLPASTLMIPEGRIFFTEQQPFMPIMDVRARAEVSGYNVQMYAYGALRDTNLALRSDPPLSQENLIFLLTTGFVPTGMSGAGLGEAAVGQGGIILLRSLARQLEPLGIDLNDFVNRLTVNVVPPRDSSQTSALVSELRLTDRFSLSTGRDGFGFYNAGVQYTIRLR